MKKCALSLYSLIIILVACNRTIVNDAHAIDPVETAEELKSDVATMESTVMSDGMTKDVRTAEHNYAEFCASCHGAKMDAFVDRKWQYGQSESDLFKAIKFGYEDDGMPAYAEAMSDQEINELVIYIKEGIQNVDEYTFEEKKNLDGVFVTEEGNVKLDTIATGLQRPWGITFLSNGHMLIADRSGDLYERTAKGQLIEIQGLPTIKEVGQGGLMDLEIHPDYANNGWLYFSYSKPHVDDDSKVTTAVMRARLQNQTLIDKEELFEALPYSSRRHHFGCRLEFDREGYLYISVGDRGNRDDNPQALDNHCGKIHRIHDDGTIPADNPYVDTEGAMASIFTYGNRNPQGVAMNPLDGVIWQNEHGPRGGDEINIVNKGLNYGWPVISYGINYNGTTFTEETHQVGMEQPVMMWLPSIGVCGMTFVKSNRYPNWQNNLLSGSLRFKYLERAVIKNNEVVHREKILENIGRLRVVEVGPDGYIYVGVEEPGIVFRLMPI